MSGTTGRVVVVRRGNTVVPNATVYDERLSYAALGLLLVVLSRPDAAPMGYRALVGRGLGEKATRDALRELDEAGYRHLFRSASGRKGMRTDVVISEVPMSREAAERELMGSRTLVDNPSHRAATGAARSDLGKQGVSAGRIVRHVSQHDGSRHDGPLHASYEAQGSSLRSEPGNSNAPCAAKPGAPCKAPGCPKAEAECDHGATHRTGCALCRAEARGPRF